MTAAAVGDQQLTPFLTPLIHDESLSVQAAAMFALHKLGEVVDFTPLSACVMENDPEVRANGYLVLGRLGNPSAMPLIEASLQQDVRRVNLMRLRMAELQGAGALVRLGRERMIEPIRAALFAPPEQAERTLLACDLLGELGDEGARPMLVRIVSNASPPYRALEVRMAAAKALLALAPPHPEALVELLRRGLADNDPRRRLQAVTALGEAEGPEVSSMLAALIDDPDPMVATVAAGAVVAREPD
jgi:HEAT repeat protein